MKNTATLKKLSAIVMSIVMLLTIFSGCIVTSAEEAGETPVNLLTDEAVVGDIYTISLEDKVPEGKFYAEFKNDLVYDNLSVAKDNGDYTFQVPDTNDFDGDGNVAENIVATQLGLTDDQVIDTAIIAGGNTDGFQLRHTSGGDVCLGGRSALGFDLGGFYNLDNFTLAQKGGVGALNISVYAGNAMDASIFNNKVGSDRVDSAEDTFDVALTGATNVRYVLVVFDQMTSFSTRKVSMYQYYTIITSLGLTGEKSENLITNPAVSGELYRIPLDDELSDGGEFNDAEKAKLVYDELIPCGNSQDFMFISKAKDEEDYDKDENVAERLTAAHYGLTDDQVLDGIATKTNSREFVIEHSSGNLLRNSNRFAIGFDLGGKYDLSAFAFAKNDMHVHNYSVYVGDVLDGTIFTNKVAEGGAKNVSAFTSMLNDKAVGRYLVIVFDHVSNLDTINQHGYKLTLTNLELYGEAVEEEVVVRENILKNKKVVGDLYRIDLGDANSLTHDASIDDAAEQAKLVYTNLIGGQDANGEFIFATYTGEDRNNNGKFDDADNYTAAENGYTNDQIIDKHILSNELTGYKINYNASGAYRLKNRGAMGFDLGEKYALDELVLTKDLTLGNKLVQASVYAGDALDATIFQNKVATARIEYADETMKFTFPEGTTAKCVLIVFDHVVTDAKCTIGQWSYTNFMLTNIELYGEATNLVNNAETVVDVATITLPVEISKNVAFDETEQAKLVYGENHTLTIGTHKIYFKRQDVNDVDGNGNTTEELPAAQLGLTNDQIVDSVLAGDVKEFIVQTPGGGTSGQWRSAIAVDLGATYDLDTLSFTNSYYGNRKLYNYSVYVGDALDTSIYTNKVAVGGSDDKAKQTFTNDLDEKACGRYVLIVFDLISQDGKTNQYAYETLGISNIELYGNVNEEALKRSTNILTDERVVGDLFRIDLAENLTQGNGAKISDEAEQAKLVYTNLNRAAVENDIRFRNKNNQMATTLDYTNNEVIKSNLVFNTSEEFSINNDVYNANQGRNKIRVAIGFELGANYDLDEFVITQNFYNGRYLTQYSVYVGDSLDASIFENKVTTGYAGKKTDTTIKVEFEEDTYASCILFVFDHVDSDQAGTISEYAYTDFMLESMALYGLEVEEPDVPSYGDVNSDGKVNVLDYITLSKVIDGAVTVEAALANLNGDESIDVNDLIVLKKILLGIEVTPPTAVILLDPDLNADGTDGVNAF